MMYNDNSSPLNDLIARYRRRLARAAIDYPTDPLSLILCVLGAICLLAIMVVDSPWRYLLIGVLTLATGVAGLVTARGRYVLYTFRITIGGATVAMLAELVLFAPFTVWWLAVLPLGAGLSSMVIYYYGAWMGLVWGAMQGVMALVGVLIALSTPEANDALLLEGLLAGELIIILVHLALALLMPEQTDIEKRTSALSQQRNELENMISKIGATADGLSRASAAIHMVTSQQSSGAEQQAAAITQAVTMLTEFMAMADRVREESRSVANLSEKTAEVSGSGQQSIRQTSEGMAHIRAQMTAIAHNIAALAQQMQRIDEIIASVSEIATQSNLLALNASIEAARAGTHGRGFAVVADEVRSLAQESQDAAMQVQAILGEIQEAMKQTVRATQTGDQRVDEGLDLSRQAGMVITQLADNIAESTDAVRNIMASIDEQSVGLEQIVRSMQGIHEVTQQNLASTRTAETVAETLSGLSEELMAAIVEHTGEELYA